MVHRKNIVIPIAAQHQNLPKPLSVVSLRKHLFCCVCPATAVTVDGILSGGNILCRAAQGKTFAATRTSDRQHTRAYSPHGTSEGKNHNQN